MRFLDVDRHDCWSCTHHATGRCDTFCDYGESYELRADVSKALADQESMIGDAKLCKIMTKCATSDCFTCEITANDSESFMTSKRDADTIKALQFENERLKTERDAAVSDINLLGNSDYALMCDICTRQTEECNYAQCGEGVCHFEWRGVQHDSEKEG